MKIIAHRGVWAKHRDQNKMSSIRSALSQGFGFETDIRAHDGRLYLSHDPIDTNTDIALFVELLNVVQSEKIRLRDSYFLNIKESGLAPVLNAAIPEKLKDEFPIFDLAVPDLLSYLDFGFCVYTRVSEYEQDRSLLEMCGGIWLDAFRSDWYSDSYLKTLINLGKPICIVSPELHSRPHNQLWTRLKVVDNQFPGKLSLCTDFPMKARDFF